MRSSSFHLKLFPSPSGSDTEGSSTALMFASGFIPHPEAAKHLESRRAACGHGIARLPEGQAFRRVTVTLNGSAWRMATQPSLVSSSSSICSSPALRCLSSDEGGRARFWKRWTILNPKLLLGSWYFALSHNFVRVSYSRQPTPSYVYVNYHLRTSI